MAVPAQIEPMPSALTPLERRLLGLLAHGQTPAEAAVPLSLAPHETEAMLADLLRRQGLSTLHQLLARALLYLWI